MGRDGVGRRPERIRFHIFLVSLHIFRFKLERSTAAVLRSMGAVIFSTPGAECYFNPPKEPLAAGDVTCEVDAIADASFGPICCSPVGRWMVESGIRGAAGDNGPVDHLLLCNHTEQVSLLHPVEGANVEQEQMESFIRHSM
jgi:hypothetical protein